MISFGGFGVRRVFQKDHKCDMLLCHGTLSTWKGMVVESYNLGRKGRIELTYLFSSCAVLGSGTLKMLRIAAGPVGQRGGWIRWISGQGTERDKDRIQIVDELGSLRQMTLVRCRAVRCRAVLCGALPCRAVPCRALPPSSANMNLSKPPLHTQHTRLLADLKLTVPLPRNLLT